jgi:hypothetical protein
MGSSSQISLGALQPTSEWGEFNQISFAIRQAISKLQTATLVRVQSVSNNGGLDPIGTVDVLPLVNQTDGNGNPEPHITVFGLPYLRIQGGANACIIDPEAGDIGVAVFASRDISNVKSTLQQSNPGSGRRYHFSDGIYIGGCLQAAAPTQYLQFNSDGVTLVTPGKLTLQSTGDSDLTASGDVTVTAPSISLGASGSSKQTLMTEAFLQYWTTTALPALAAHGITIASPPSNSVTSALEAS